MRDYLTTADILGIHHALLERYGGAGGLRDRGALEAAVFRPQCGYYNDIIDEAAVLLESLLIDYPFIDGNKRVAFAACDVFLRINGYRLSASSVWVFERMMAWIADAENRLELIKHDLANLISRQVPARKKYRAELYRLCVEPSRMRPISTVCQHSIMRNPIGP